MRLKPVRFVYGVEFASMPSLESVGAAFTAALVSQAESAPARTILVRLPFVPDVSTPLTTSDATRGAFASSLHEIDALNAPPVIGPYVPGFAAVSGPLTDADIYDPSQLYSLPERGLVPFGEAGSDAGRSGSPGALSGRSSNGGVDAARVAASKPDTQASLAAYFDQDGPDDESAALAPRPVDLHVPTSFRNDASPAFSGPPLQELNAVQLAAYLDLMRTGLFPAKLRDARRPTAKREAGDPWWHDPDGFEANRSDADAFDPVSDETPRRRSATGD